MARTAPYFPQAYVGDGATSNFALNFSILENAHLRVVVGGVLKTLGVDYSIQDAVPVAPAIYTSLVPGADTSKKHVQFLPAKIPANTAAIQFFRNTPIARPSGKNVEVGPDTALYAHFRQQERDDAIIKLEFVFNATDLAAHTSQGLVAPCDGYITGLETDVTEAVTTGGNVGVNVESTAVAGMVIAVASSAPIGKLQLGTPTTQQSTTTKVQRGQAVNVTAATFATAGALRGRVLFQPADLT